MNDKIIKIAVFDILCLPLYLYTYELLPVLFWILLILIDSYEIKQIDTHQLIQSLNQAELLDPANKKMIILTIGYAIGVGIIAFKNFAVAGILIVNEMLLSLVSFVNMNHGEKK